MSFYARRRIVSDLILRPTLAATTTRAVSQIGGGASSTCATLSALHQHMPQWIQKSRDGGMIVPSPARCFSSAKMAKERKTSSNDAASTGGYYERKNAAKERRRALYEKKQERIEKLKTRRQGARRGQKSKEFRSWFIKRKVDEEYMNRKARQAGLGWKMQVSVVLVRDNIVIPDMEEWEKDYEDLRAHLDQFGKMYPKEFLGFDPEETEVATTQEDLLAMLPKDLVLAPRETEADMTGDVRTVDRKLKTDIYLAVRDGEDGKWQFPTVTLKDDETLLEAAKRALAEKIGPRVEYYSISNCPVAVDMVAHPIEDREADGVYGTKTFFMRLNHDEGDVSDDEMTAKDFAWLDREEMMERVREDRGDYKFYRYML